MKAKLLNTIAAGVRDKNTYNDTSYTSIMKLCEEEAYKGKFSIGIVNKLPYNPSILKSLTTDEFEVTVENKNSIYSLIIKW